MNLSTILQDKLEKKRKFDTLLSRTLIFIFLACFVCFLFYCIIVPNVTGQFCPDFVSGHVPEKAEELFLQRIMSAIVAQDYNWLATVSTENGLEHIKEIQPLVTKKFKVIGGDDLAGLYERVIEFENGSVVYLTFRGSWSCPDFVVSEQEIFGNLKLTYIEKRDE